MKGEKIIINNYRIIIWIPKLNRKNKIIKHNISFSKLD